MFVDCFEAPPGSQGYTAIVGCVTLAIVLVLMAALSYGWFIDGTTHRVQATGAIALIAGSPAIVASLLPLRHDGAAVIRPPLTSRFALWASSAMSVFIALALATQGFGLDLAKLKGVNIGWCFLRGLIVAAVVVGALFVMRRAVYAKRFWPGFWSIVAISVVVFIVADQGKEVSSFDTFFSVAVPLYVLVLARCVYGWLKSVYVASTITRNHLFKSML